MLDARVLVLAVSRGSCATAKTCDLVHTGSGAYGVVLMAVGILLLGVVLLVLTWRARPNPSARAMLRPRPMANLGATVHMRTSEEPESDARDARDAHLAAES